MKRILILAFFYSVNSYAVDLLQEEKNILCSNAKISVSIDKKDQFIEVKEKDQTQTYKKVEFLDTGILVLDEKNSKSGLIQLVPQDKAIFISGDLTKFTESSCEDVGALKKCSINQNKLEWSSEKIKYEKVNYDIIHYGVHPNDGTYFIGASKNNQAGLGILDFGSNVSFVQGPLNKLDCKFQ